nr:transglycosylase SLT domain-containing protein [Nocardia acididurans]
MRSKLRTNSKRTDHRSKRATGNGIALLSIVVVAAAFCIPGSESSPRMPVQGLSTTLSANAVAGPAARDVAFDLVGHEMVMLAGDPNLLISRHRYTDDVNGWILESLEVMRDHGIPGSYEGIHRTIMRESSGDRFAINLWDSNAAQGIPSKGLMQVIDPTFAAYHVDGTSWDIYDPVANIVAACNYAADRYGSIDNVFSAY